MPRFNPVTGQAVMGVAGTQPSVDGVSKGSGVSGSPTVWLDSAHILHQVGDILAKTHVASNVTTILGGQINELSAGCCGTYLAWGATPGLFGAKVLALGGLNRVITDARGCNSPDGAIAYIAVRSSDLSPTIVQYKGMQVELPNRYGMHLLKWGQGVWNEGLGVLGFWGTSCAYIPGAQYAKIAKVGSTLWIVYDLPGIGLIAHLAINPTVYHLISADGTFFHHDAIGYAGKLATCHSTTTGEGAGNLVKVMDVVATCPSFPVPVDIVAGGAIVGPAIPAVAEVAQEIKLAGKYPEFADLKIPLAQSKQTDNALSQVVATMIDRLTQGQSVTARRIEQVKEAGSRIATAIEDRTSKASIHTKFDDRLVLPNSVQLLAGENIIFDDSVAGKRTISATVPPPVDTAPEGYWTPLTDGNMDETQLIFAAGECIAVFVPTL